MMIPSRTTVLQKSLQNCVKQVKSFRKEPLVYICAKWESVPSGVSHGQSPLNGSQYVATEYKKATENMQRSYSKKAFPWDNACIESFHSIIKREWLNRFKIRDYKQAYRLIFEYLEAFYNTKRIHSHCNYMSPNEFERVYERTHTEAELLAG